MRVANKNINREEKKLFHKRFLILGIIGLVLLTGCRESVSKEVKEEKPYKATTVDECVHEKDLINAFSSVIVSRSEIFYLKEEIEKDLEHISMLKKREPKKSNIFF